jgi:hypothetical protein
VKGRVRARRARFGEASRLIEDQPGQQDGQDGEGGESRDRGGRRGEHEAGDGHGQALAVEGVDGSRKGSSGVTRCSVSTSSAGGADVVVAIDGDRREDAGRAMTPAF